MKVNNMVEPLQPVATNQIAEAQSSPKLTEPQAYFADDNVSLSVNGRSALDAEQNVRGQADGAISLKNGRGQRPPTQTQLQQSVVDDNVSLSVNGRSALDVEQNVRGQGDGAVSLENGWGRRPPE